MLYMYIMTGTMKCPAQHTDSVSVHIMCYSCWKLLSFSIKGRGYLQLKKF